ncbi:MAG: DUF1553 domain-containing protein [Verrucomicrobia bacterium]|nr:DUF1553 domain-containing protein [Verrucomicrobiota bacterium]
MPWPRVIFWMCCLTALTGRAAEGVDYARDVKPLLKARCYSCHGALEQKAGLRLDTAASMLRGSKKGPVVQPGKPDESSLLARIDSHDADERMPPEGEPLSAEQQAKFRAWILAGATAPPDEKPESDPKDHWAFKPPVKAPLPSAALTLVAEKSDPTVAAFFAFHGPANPIDAWISTRRQAAGLSSLGQAPKSILLRRVYLDLAGHPPTRAEIEAFLDDSSEDAYERVVDRLLNAPAHGERWARHWMDIWRYSDWYGRRQVPDVWNSAPQVWRWREWIVRSLNEDKGYDRMLAEMLAGDELAPQDDGARAATGYLVRNWYALNKNQWLRDVVEHTGKAFLGLTFNCAHCHDHKYDPIRHEDYFRFRAFFEPIQVRQDWVQGEADPGPFQKYDYSTLRRVVTNGIVSVFDETLDARTFIYLRGDERSFPDGKPTVEPGLPRFLRADPLAAERVHLPSQASYPGSKAFIREAELAKRLRALDEAVNAREKADREFEEARAQFSPSLAPVERAQAFSRWLAAETLSRQRFNQWRIAQADLEAVQNRLAADGAPLPPPTPAASSQPASDVSQSAITAEKRLALRKAEAELDEAEASLALFEAEQAMAEARRKAGGAAESKEEKVKAEAARKSASEKVTAQRRRLEALPANLQTNLLAHTPFSPKYPSQSTGRRAALARWLASPENPLTARVAVNHIWTRHFHTPLVATTFDLGRNGSQPAHPELLDWLAADLMEHGWSMKHLHRLIVTSQTYRQASSPDDSEAAAKRFATQREKDPENKLFWRMNAGQMEAEVLRDSLLHLAGELDFKAVGYPLPNSQAETNRHRSLYFECFPEPLGQSAFAELFDAPNPNECYRRSQTIVPQQALALSNSKLGFDQSRALAGKLAPITDARQFVQHAWEHILARRPTEAEVAKAVSFLDLKPSALSSAPGAPRQDSTETLVLAARAGLVHALFNHHEFVTIR